MEGGGKLLRGNRLRVGVLLLAVAKLQDQGPGLKRSGNLGAPLIPLEPFNRKQTVLTGRDAVHAEMAVLIGTSAIFNSAVFIRQ